MPSPLTKYRDPYITQRIAISAGGSNQITIVTFPNAPQDMVLTIQTSVAMQFTHRGDEGDAIEDEFAADIFINGNNEIPVSGWGTENGTPQIRIACATQNTNARFIVSRRS